MRQIKFRAWDFEEVEMIQPEDLLTINENRYLNESLAHDEKVTFMQFTGLTDKKGNDIYEGDIVNWQAGYVKGIDAIIYDDGGFCIDSSFQDDMSIYQSYASEALEVVGNIHQNPELLERT